MGPIRPGPSGKCFIDGPSRNIFQFLLI
jgi:hypothetical protein